MLLFYKRSPQTILKAAIILYLIAKLFEYHSVYQEHLEFEVLAKAQGVSVMEVVVPVDPGDLVARQENERVGVSGTFLEVSRSRLGFVWKAFSNWRYYPNTVGLLGYMLFGLYLAKRGVIRDQDVRNSIARRALPWLLGTGLTGSLIFVLMQSFGYGAPGELAHKIILDLANWPAGAIGLGLAYAAIITLLMQRQAWQRWLAPFVIVGRLALTNYIISCFVYAIVFSPWGFGLYSLLMPLEGLVIVLLVYPILVIASRWWISHFRFGPFEWMWRSMTYGKLTPMRTQKPAV